MVKNSETDLQTGLTANERELSLIRMTVKELFDLRVPSRPFVVKTPSAIPKPVQPLTVVSKSAGGVHLVYDLRTLANTSKSVVVFR